MAASRIMPVALLLAGALLVGVGGCFGETSAPDARSQANGHSERPRGTDAPGSQTASSDDGGSRSKPVLLPLYERTSPLRGARDLKNLYASTVIVKTAQASGSQRHCSGVLVDPRLVLTAAHCVCTPRRTSSSAGAKQGLIDGSSCAKTATVATVMHHPQQEGLGGSEDSDKSLRHHPGEVRPHPQLKILLDAEGIATEMDANLAVVRLNRPVEDALPVARLSAVEPKLDEPLIVVGYSPDRSSPGSHGVRLFGESKAMKALLPGSEGALFEQTETSGFSGESGSPCFRQLEEGVALVGILARELGERSLMTSTARYREWLSSEIQQVGRED
jgi:hypothetical protein